MARLLTLLDIVSQAAMEIGISQNRVTTVVSTLDQDIAQMRSLLSAVADEIMTEEPYRTTLGDQIWIENAETGAPQHTFAADGDLIRFDGRLAIDGLKWRFMYGKGLEYAEIQRDFTSRLNKLAARANARVLDLDAEWSRVQ